MKLGLEPAKPIGNKIKSPFGVSQKSSANPVRPKPAEPAVPVEEKSMFGGNFVSTLTPIISRLPVKVLPDYKPFAEAGIELTKNAVQNSGILQYFSFEPFKNYFNITNLYVLRKLLLVIAPYSDTVRFIYILPYLSSICSNCPNHSNYQKIERMETTNSKRLTIFSPWSIWQACAWSLHSSHGSRNTHFACRLQSWHY